MNPTFDTWTSGFLFAVAMGLFLFVILITNRNKRNYAIAFLILAFSLILFQYVLYWTKYEIKFPYLRILPTMCYYATGPLLYLYFLNLYKKRINFNYTLHFLPAFILFIINILWLINLSFKTLNFQFSVFENYIVIIVHMLTYIVLIIRLITNEDHTNSEYKILRYKWSKVLVLLYGLFILAYISYYVLVNFSFFSAEWDYMISIMMSVTIYTIGYFVFKQPKVFDGEFFSELFLPIKHKGEAFETALLNEFYDNLIDYIKKEKPYKNNELRLVNLADQLGYSTHLLSKIINEKSGQNFNQFINTYRLIEVENLIKTDKTLSIKSIYFEVGFNNKVTFNTAFKKRYHCTPTAYKNNIYDI
jgi:AraC-like DNA-binding protein